MDFREMNAVFILNGVFSSSNENISVHSSTHRSLWNHFFLLLLSQYKKSFQAPAHYNIIIVFHLTSLILSTLKVMALVIYQTQQCLAPVLLFLCSHSACPFSDNYYFLPSSQIKNVITPTWLNHLTLVCFCPINTQCSQTMKLFSSVTIIFMYCHWC